MLDEKEFNVLFAKNLSRFMSLNNYKQIDLARILKVSTSTINSWVRAQRTPRMDKIDALCQLFGCKRSDLIADYTPASAESDEGEAEILEFYRGLNDRGKDMLLNFIRMTNNTEGRISQTDTPPKGV